MKRRDFLALSGSFIPLQMMLPYQVFSIGSDRSEKLALIDEIRNYLLNELSLNIGSKFYTEWKENKHLMHFVVYVSDADRIAIPNKYKDIFKASNIAYRSFGDHFSAAEKFERTARENGYHTLMYQTAGVSYSKLNDRLLSYTPESIAFIAMHEAAHRHIRSGQLIPYEIEEATCEVIGNYGTKEFIGLSKVITKDALETQKTLHENLHHTVNELTIQVRNTLPEKSSKLYKSGRNQIKQLIKTGGKFVKDRYNYQVNNAYLLRNIYYAENYFLMKRLYFQLNSLKEFIEFVTTLPNDLMEAKGLINEKLKGKVVLER